MPPSPAEDRLRSRGALLPLRPGVLPMMPPQSMPIGFTCDGQPMYAAAPRLAGERQPLAVLADGEPVWPVSGSVVPPGQPQPFGVLSSGAFVWAVEQHPPAPPAPWFRRRGVPVAGAALVALVGVGVVAAGSSDERPPQATQQADEDRLAAEQAEREAAEQAEQADAPEPEAAPPALDFVMPDLTGSTLQVAQDEVQELGVFFSISHDLRGTRAQVLDSGWQVCDQTPAAGTRVRGAAADWEGRIDFGVVRLGESCP